MELEDMAKVGEALQERRSEPGITEDLSSAGEVQVSGHQHLSTLVAVDEETEEQSGPRLGDIR